MKDHYYSLTGPSEGFYKEKGSKFLAFAYPVESEKQVRERLNELKQTHHSARHRCYAFVLKPNEGQEETYRSSDAGEPAHSAGDPILGQIRAYQLQDVLLVVVRYFGGTKLDVGGLIQAYKTAAADALANAPAEKKYIERSLKINFLYTATNQVMRTVNQYQMTIQEQSFAEMCDYLLSVRLNHYDVVVSRLSELNQVTVKH